MHNQYNSSFEKNDPIVPNLYYVVAELHYKCKNYAQARDFYLKNKVAYIKEKKINTHAFEAYIAATPTFDKDDMTYLTSLVGNIGKQLKNLSVSASVNNVFVISKYKGFDPEVNVDKALNGVPSLGIDYIGYPTQRTFLLGVSFQL